MEVYECGTQVRFLETDIYGFITGIKINKNVVSYCVDYFCNEELKTVEVYEYQFITRLSEEKKGIGFKAAKLNNHDYLVCGSCNMEIYGSLKNDCCPHCDGNPNDFDN